MNQFDNAGGREAKVKYLDGDFQVVTHGQFVVCAVTGQHIPLDELRYWSVARQEAYASCAASLDAEKRAGALPVQKR